MKERKGTEWHTYSQQYAGEITPNLVAWARIALTRSDGAARRLERDPGLRTYARVQTSLEMLACGAPCVVLS